MSLGHQLTDALRESPGDAPFVFNGPDGVRAELDLVAVEQLGCAFRELRLALPALSADPCEKLHAWAAELSRRVTYLLEKVGPLELDPAEQELLVRSTPPDRQPDRIQYYEIRLHPGALHLRRYRATPHQPGREPIDVQLTFEVLQKLVDDLVTAANGAPV